MLETSIGLIYIWFGALKLFPSLSPAETLAKNTIDILSCGLIPSSVSFLLLAVWETLIGGLLLINIQTKIVVKVAIIHMVFTFSPLFIFPGECFNVVPFQLTLVGQYILKNLILVSALMTLYSSYKTQIKLVE
jgi:uncharacterized membrane protein YphA (DoxX/SURF4 family)